MVSLPRKDPSWEKNTMDANSPVAPPIKKAYRSSEDNALGTLPRFLCNSRTTPVTRSIMPNIAYNNVTAVIHELEKSLVKASRHIIQPAINKK